MKKCILEHTIWAIGVTAIFLIQAKTGTMNNFGHGVLKPNSGQHLERTVRTVVFDEPPEKVVIRPM